jgi:hypothetical protein
MRNSGRRADTPHAALKAIHNKEDAFNYLPLPFLAIGCNF